MSRRRRVGPRFWTASVALGALACGGGVPRAALTPGDETACCLTFDYLLEASIFRIDVMRLTLLFDSATARAMGRAVATGPRNGASDDLVARAALAATWADARMAFILPMSGERFVGNTEAVLHRLGEEGLLSEAEVSTLVAAARRRFSFLQGPGVKRGDVLEQQLRADSVTTTYLTLDGRRLFSDVQVGPEHRRALLGSYFAKGSDFRDGLLDLAYARP